MRKITSILIAATLNACTDSSAYKDPIKFCSSPPNAGEMVKIDNATLIGQESDVIGKIETCGDHCMLFPIPLSLKNLWTKEGAWADGPLKTHVSFDHRYDKYYVKTDRAAVIINGRPVPMKSSNIVYSNHNGIEIISYSDRELVYYDCGRPVFMADIQSVISRSRQ